MLPKPNRRDHGYYRRCRGPRPAEAVSSSSRAPRKMFSPPPNLTDDQKLIGQTAEEFVRNEVVPAIPDLEQHKPGLMPSF